MADRPSPRAAGSILALLTIVGAVCGVAAGQPTIGLLAGFALGTAIALLTWLVDRRRG